HLDGMRFENFAVGAQEYEPPLIHDVTPGSAASSAGLLPGDVILRLNGDSLHDTESLFRRLSATRIGAQVRLSLSRSNTERELTFPMPSVLDSGVFHSRTGLTWRDRVSGWHLTYREAIQYLHLLNA